MKGMTLQRWLTSTPTGKTILNIEKQWVDQIITKWFGSYLLHFGEIGAGELCEQSRISRHAVISPNLTSQTTICCAFDELPFASESVDCIILPHVLENTLDPLSILKEVERILIADGHVIILGFNPYSPSGLWRIMGSWRTMQSEPYFYSSRQLKLWLFELGFEVVREFRGFCRPPLSNTKWLEKLIWMEKLLFISNIYGLAIQKRRLISPAQILRPARQPRWANVPEPTVLRHDNDTTC